MKKTLLTAVIALLAMVAASGVSAQTIGEVRFGAFGGFTSARTKDVATNLLDFDVKRMPLYHAGLTAQFPLGGAFSIQPTVSWHVKGSSIAAIQDSEKGLNFEAFRSKIGYLEAGAQLQAGLDLLAFRPYLFLEPFAGYALNVDEKLFKTDADTPYQEVKAFDQSALRRMEYGLGVGFGAEVWLMQLSFKWFWNFGNLYDERNAGNADMATLVKGLYDKGRNFNGFVMSVSIFFL
ncbi:MAG: PorT family protein [Bacteroidales bacterium]|nr:PorT family protein [Bacteroidales bacterium]